jgi:hypothetical protein
MVRDPGADIGDISKLAVTPPPWSRASYLTPSLHPVLTRSAGTDLQPEAGGKEYHWVCKLLHIDLLRTCYEINAFKSLGEEMTSTESCILSS